MSFQTLSHSPSHERALALTSPPPDFLFISIPQCPQPHNPHHPTQNSNIPYWYCLPSTPSLTLPPSSLKCLQKSNPNIHRKCFKCFKCFGCFRCFMFAFGPQNRPILVQIRTNPANRPNRPTAISWLRKTPKKAIHPLVCEHDTALFVIAAVLFRRSGFFGRRSGKPRRQTRHRRWRIVGDVGKELASPKYYRIRWTPAGG